MKSLHLEVDAVKGAFSLQANLSLVGSGTLVVLGASGSGKTSLLRIIAGLERPQRGFVATDKRVLFNSAQNLWLPARRRNIGYLFQDYALFDHMTVRGNIAYGIRDKARLPMVDHWLERLELGPYANRYPARLSGGQRQRVALARVLVTQPDLLLLDEPFSAIDQSLRGRIREEVKTLLQESDIPAIVVSHDIGDAQAMADHIMLMDNGRVLQFGPRSRMLSRPESERAARLLGWRNILPLQLLVSHGLIDAGEITASPGDAGETQVAVSAWHWRFGDGGSAALPVAVRSVADKGAVREVQVVVDGSGTLLHLDIPWSHPAPLPGERTRITVSSDHICPLRRDSNASVSGHIVFTPRRSGPSADESAVAPSSSNQNGEYHEHYADYQAAGY